MVQYPLPDSGDCGTFEANPDKASGPFLNHTRCLPTPTDHPMRPLIYAVVLSLLWYPAISPAQKDVRSSPAKQAGESLAQLIIDQDSEGLTDRIDMKVLLDRVMRGMDLSVDPDGKFIRDVVRLAIKPIWNAYNFFCLYANSDSIKAEISFESENVLDKYILPKIVHGV